MARIPEHFYFGGVSSRDYGIYLTDAIEIAGAQPNMDKITVPGRNGDLIRYDGSYQNIEFAVKCFIKSSSGISAERALSAAKRWLTQEKGYRRLELPWEDGYRLAYVAVPPGTEALGPDLRTFSVSFSCKPQVYTYEGEQSISLTRAATLFNSGMPALPLITLYGSGSGTLTVGDTVVTIKSMSGSLTLDCDLQDAYQGTENKNSSISAPSFPVLETGDNIISFTGGVNRVEIVPRWWHL
mgnify:CR=1 FL=1